MAELELNKLFQVTETRDFTDGGVVIARYQPSFPYRVTERNRAFVQGMIDEGVANLDQAPVGTVKSGHAEAAGRVSVGKPKGK